MPKAVVKLFVKRVVPVV